MMSYKTIIDDMNAYIASEKYPGKYRSTVYEWKDAYSEINHERMARVVELLNKHVVDDNFYLNDITFEDQAEIYNIGCDIGEEGGITAQIACYYISANFMKNDNPILIKRLWRGAGEWEREKFANVSWYKYLETDFCFPFFPL